MTAILGASALGEPVGIDKLVNPQGIDVARISPDGKHIATIGFDGYFTYVNIADSDTLQFKWLTGTQSVRDGFYIMKSQPRDVVWLSDRMLAVNFDFGARAYTIDGDEKAALGKRAIRAVEGGDPDHPQVIVYTDLEDKDVALVDAVSGEKVRYRFPMSGTPLHIAFDRRGLPRAITMADSAFWKDSTTISNWYRPSATAQWQKLAEFKITDDYWIPLYIPDAPDKLVVVSREGRDTYAIFNYDTAHHTMGSMLAGYPDQDVLLADRMEREVFQHVWTGGIKPDQAWFDPVWAKIQADVDVTYPGRINVVSGNPDTAILIYSYSDTEPGAWYVYDTRKVHVRALGLSRDGIKADEMRPMHTVTYQAKDGLTIPAYLTLPEGGGKGLPTVVMIHGGPAQRDHWTWDHEVQFLASRGYAVFQPQFRGSTGFGRRFEQAGYGQWGLAMQDDVTAGVHYLIAQGIADPGRICIYGASYGGYAALWGLVKTPDLYRCGISFAGVTDLELMFNDSSDRNSKKTARELMRSRIGDPGVNKQQFDQVSPLKSAHLIKAPVLLMHGEKDERVPIVHGKRMLKALQDSGKQVQWETFEKEGHGLFYVASQRRYLELLGAFLDKHLEKK